MEHNNKKTGRFRRMLLGMMGPVMSRKIIAFLLRKRLDKSPAGLPSDLGRSSDILFILPEDRTEMVYQLENIFSILGRFKESNITFLCPAAHVSFVSALPDTQVIKYDPDDFRMYSAEFGRLVAEFASRAFDICVVLERNYSLALLYMIGMSRAHIRVGWSEDTLYPFINVRIAPADRDDINLWERNLEVANLLDAKTDTAVRWGVPKSTIEDVAQLMSEHKLKKDVPLVCVDILSIENNCGKAWCGELLKALAAVKGVQFYIFGGPEEEKHSFTDTTFTTLPPMSVPRTAALIAGTNLIMTGAGALLGLAQISQSKIVPILTHEQVTYLCKNDGRIMPVTFAKDEDPGEEQIRAAVKNIKAQLGS